MSQIGAELIQNVEKDILITLMYSRASQQILFVEAEKDFVDLVVGFLTLPIGCAIRLLSESERSSDPIAVSTESNGGLHSHEHCICYQYSSEVRTYKSISKQEQLQFHVRYCRLDKLLSSYSVVVMKDF